MLNLSCPSPARRAIGHGLSRAGRTSDLLSSRSTGTLDPSIARRSIAISRSSGSRRARSRAGGIPALTRVSPGGSPVTRRISPPSRASRERRGHPDLIDSPALSESHGRRGSCPSSIAAYVCGRETKSPWGGERTSCASDYDVLMQQVVLSTRHLLLAPYSSWRLTGERHGGFPERGLSRLISRDDAVGGTPTMLRNVHAAAKWHV